MTRIIPRIRTLVILLGVLPFCAAVSQADCGTDTSRCPDGPVITTCYTLCSDGTTSCCQPSSGSGCDYNGPSGDGTMCQTNSCSDCPTTTTTTTTVPETTDRKSTRLNSSHANISY